MSDKKNIHISFSNKIPQWAIRQTIEGALQPKTASKRHPELVPNTELIDIINRKNANVKSPEEIQKDLDMISIVSPSVKHLATSELNIKKANSSSRLNDERKEAVSNSQCQKTPHMAAETLDSNIVRAGRVGKEMESEEHSKYAMRQPGGMSIFDQKIEVAKTPSDSVSEFSKKLINEKKHLAAQKYINHKTAEEVKEEQKARKLGGLNEITGMYQASFASSNQAFMQNNSMTSEEQEQQRLDSTYNMFRKQAKPNNEYQKLAKYLSKKLVRKIKEAANDKSNWWESAVKDIEKRVEVAEIKSEKLAEKSEIEREKIASRPVPTVEQLREALNRDKVIVDTKENSKIANQEYKVKIGSRENARKAVVSELTKQVVRPSTKIVDSMINAISPKKTAGKQRNKKSAKKEGNGDYEII